MSGIVRNCPGLSGERKKLSGLVWRTDRYFSKGFSKCLVHDSVLSGLVWRTKKLSGACLGLVWRTKNLSGKNSLRLHRSSVSDKIEIRTQPLQKASKTIDFHIFGCGHRALARRNARSILSRTPLEAPKRAF